MPSRKFAALSALPCLLVLSGCGYVHVGRLPQATTTVVGDAQLIQENSDLKLEKKILQQELALSRAQGDALRMTVENRNADGDTSRRLVEKLNETTRELATLRASYAQLQAQRTQPSLNTDAAALQARLGATEEKLAASLRSYTELQEEVGRLRTDVARVRAENVTLAEQARVATAENAQAQAALAQLNNDLLSQKEARALAERDVDALRTELKTVSPNSSVLSHLRTGAAGQARALGGEAPETIVLRQELEALRSKVAGLETERAQLRQKLASTAPAPELAHLEARLATAEQTAAQLRTENEQLKTGGDASLREQLQSAQSAARSLTEENERLRRRIATATPVAQATERPRLDLGSGDGSAPSGSSVPSPTPAASPASSDQGGSGADATFISVISRPGGVGASNGKMHTVTAGDTLAKISERYYGTPSRWSDILAANRDVLGENNHLVVGRTLRIP